MANYDPGNYPHTSVAKVFTHSVAGGLAYATVATAPPGQSIVVLAFTLSSSAAEICLLASGSANKQITGYLQFAAAGTLVAPFTPGGWCRTGAGEDLKVAASVAASTTTWTIVYTVA